MTKSKPPRREKPVKARKRDKEFDALVEAAGKYIEAKGGAAIVAGPVQIMRWPGDPEYKFTLCVQITGRAPKPPVSP